MEPFTVWDVFFAQAAAMLLHPGYKCDPIDAVNEACEIANYMMTLREENLCQFSQREQH